MDRKIVKLWIRTKISDSEVLRRQGSEISWGSFPFLLFSLAFFLVFCTEKKRKRESRE
uniref:Uncharacterized protein n=1 Tax=Nelumbo nucifera TaxID=4432 RepID=A0A822Z9P3_NELNU|nr:TPA_asm: hypothetical protein HUJ06_008889 [Nelumbo nucifera]